MRNESYDARTDRLADRLADALEDAVSSLEAIRRSRTLTDDEAATALSGLLAARGIRLNDDFLRSVAATHRR